MNGKNREINSCMFFAKNRKREKHYPMYPKDDYFEINERYFSEILKQRDWVALPSGWQNPEVITIDAFRPITPKMKDLKFYSIDEGGSLNKCKEAISGLVSEWEGRDVNSQNITLAPSVSASTLIILMTLKNRGIKNIFFETPAYFATLDQAKMLEFNIVMIPCWIDNDFDYSLEQWAEVISTQSPCAIWITQPRFGIGKNQDLSKLQGLVGSISPESVLVIDEAVEQNFPAHTSSLYSETPAIIKTKGIFKGLGLNGLRISVISHPKAWRASFENALDGAAASIDQYSLANAVSISNDTNLFKIMLGKAREQVMEGKSIVDNLTKGSWIKPSRLENGYMGSLFLDLTQFNSSFMAKREALLKYCQRERIPVILSSALKFAFDDRWEAIRINFFTSKENIERSTCLLLDAQSYLSKL